jgi:hypothetical protein
MINPSKEGLSPDDRRFLLSAINLHNEAAKKVHQGAHGLHGLHNFEVSHSFGHGLKTYVRHQARLRAWEDEEQVCANGLAHNISIDL